MDKDLNGAMKSVSINSTSTGARACCGASAATTATTADAAWAKSATNGKLSTNNTNGKQSCNCSQRDEIDFVKASNQQLEHEHHHHHHHHHHEHHNANAANAKVNANANSSAVVTSSSSFATIGNVTFTLNSQYQQEQEEANNSPPPPYANASEAEKRKMVHELCQQLVLTDEQIQELNYRILHEVKKGLAKDTHDKANVKCFVTYVQDLPNGNERGKFLALDLGGTNFRVLLIHLSEDHDFQMESRIYAVPQHIMLGSGTQLFDHIAQCLADFMKEHQVYSERLPLGFTFSFPLRQLGLTRGELVTWTKGFDCEGVVDQDVVQLLKDAIARRNDVQIDVCAILNDTTGTLMSCAWKNRHCKIGLIVGTGCNVCYAERVEEVELFEHSNNGKPHVLINTEWGAFGDNGALDFVRTEFDKDVDEHSINRGKQTFEKMISGMYMGELVRLVMVKMVKAGVLFKGINSDVLMSRGQFFTKYVSEIEADEPGTYTNCRLVLEELGLNNATDEDCANVRHICECVSTRAAHLVSCGIATLINKMGEPHTTVGIDGSVYRFHPKFHNLMVEKISQLIKPDITFDLMLSEDGSGRGAALVAAVACREDPLPPVE